MDIYNASLITLWFKATKNLVIAYFVWASILRRKRVCLALLFLFVYVLEIFHRSLKCSFLRFMIVCYLILFGGRGSPKSITSKFTFFFLTLLYSLLTYVTHRSQSRGRCRFDGSFIDCFPSFFPHLLFLFQCCLFVYRILLLFTFLLTGI